MGRQCDENDQGNYRMTGTSDPETGVKTLTCRKFKNTFVEQSLINQLSGPRGLMPSNAVRV